ncbi:MAG: signal peptidase I [Ruminococcus sp.]|nr:signal peptidase I [Ruminococcus sp.]
MKKSSVRLKNRIFSEVISFLEIGLISAFVMTLIFTYIMKISTVEGESMMNTLAEGDTVIASVMYSEPENGDIVIINAYESVVLNAYSQPQFGEGLNKQIVKRIIATEGQTVNIDFSKGIVYVDGQALDEPYVSSLTHLDEGAFTGKYPVTVPDGYVFVMGDNRSVSKDSRSAEIGFVSVDDIVGKVVFRFLPLNKIGFVD